MPEGSPPGDYNANAPRPDAASEVVKEFGVRDMKDFYVARPVNAPY
jgi:hypothetical protein